MVFWFESSCTVLGFVLCRPCWFLVLVWFCFLFYFIFYFAFLQYTLIDVCAYRLGKNCVNSMVEFRMKYF